MSNETDIKDLQDDVAALKKQLERFQREFTNIIDEAARTADRLEKKVQKLRVT